jgi:hypothetical protein
MNKYMLGPYDVTYEYSFIRSMVSLKYKVKFGNFYPFCSAGFFIGKYLTDKGIMHDRTSDHDVRFNRGGAGPIAEKFTGKIIYGVIGEFGFDYRFLSKQRNAAFSIYFENSFSSPTINAISLGIKQGIVID